MAPDFRSQRMATSEGRGRARRAWDAYVRAVDKHAMPVMGPVVGPVARPLAAAATADLLGFWLVWHLEGGFEGLRRIGMSRSAIYRRISWFRQVSGQHPDEYEVPGVTFDLAAYQRAGGPPAQPADDDL